MSRHPYTKYDMSNLDPESYKKFNITPNQFTRMVIDYRDETGMGIMDSKKILLKAFSIIKSLDELYDVYWDIGRDLSNCTCRYKCD